MENSLAVQHAGLRKRCPSCWTVFRSDWNFCTGCGFPLNEKAHEILKGKHLEGSITDGS